MVGLFPQRPLPAAASHIGHRLHGLVSEWMEREGWGRVPLLPVVCVATSLVFEFDSLIRLLPSYVVFQFHKDPELYPQPQ